MREDGEIVEEHSGCGVPPAEAAAEVAGGVVQEQRVEM